MAVICCAPIGGALLGGIVGWTTTTIDPNGFTPELDRPIGALFGIAIGLVIGAFVGGLVLVRLLVARRATPHA